MKLDNLLNSELIFWDVDVANSLQMYEMISAQIEKMFSLSKQEILDAFLEREKLGYVVFPDGSSVPHGRIEGFEDLIISLVKTKKPIDFAGKKADVFYCTLTSNSGSNRYLMVLASFAKIVQRHQAKIRDCKAPRQLIELIKSLDLDVDKSLLISDIINPEAVLTVQKGDSVAEAVDKMKEKSLKYLPVVDEKGCYVGKLDAFDIIRAAYPKSSFLMSTLSFMSTSRSFEKFHQMEKTLKVGDICSDDKLRIVRENEQVLQVGFKMLKNGWHHLTVVDEQGKPLAVLSDRSFVSKVLRA